MTAERSRWRPPLPRHLQPHPAAPIARGSDAAKRLPRPLGSTTCMRVSAPGLSSTSTSSPTSSTKTTH
jgi:hypothetical protein